MIELPWPQISGAIAGGLVGGLAGFVTNNIQQRVQTRLLKRNVACALLAEVYALSSRVEHEYLKKLTVELNVLKTERRYPSHRFSGQKEYAQVYRSLGQNIGILPNSLVRELVSWYISLAVFQERAAELHELAMRRDPELLDYTIEVVELQYADFSELIAMANPLIERLSRF